MSFPVFQFARRIRLAQLNNVRGAREARKLRVQVLERSGTLG